MTLAVTFVLGWFASVCAAQQSTLYGVKYNFPASAELIRIDPATAGSTVVGPIGFQNVSNMTFDPTTNTIYGVNSTPAGDDLITIDPATGAGTLVGPIGHNFVIGLAYDPSSGMLLGLDNALESTDLLLAIDRNTGAATSILLAGLEGAAALAFDSGGTLFAVDTGDTDVLTTISSATGSGSPIGPLGFDQVVDFAFDPVTGTLYGTDFDTDELIAVDTSTGTATAVVSFGFPIAGGLTFVPVPEPESVLLVGVALTGLSIRRRYRSPS